MVKDPNIFCSPAPICAFTLRCIHNRLHNKISVTLRKVAIAQIKQTSIFSELRKLHYSQQQTQSIKHPPPLPNLFPPKSNLFWRELYEKETASVSKNSLLAPLDLTLHCSPTLLLSYNVSPHVLESFNATHVTANSWSVYCLTGAPLRKFHNLAVLSLLAVTK